MSLYYTCFHVKLSELLLKEQPPLTQSTHMSTNKLHLYQSAELHYKQKTGIFSVTLKTFVQPHRCLFFPSSFSCLNVYLPHHLLFWTRSIPVPSPLLILSNKYDASFLKFVPLIFVKNRVYSC